MENLWASNCEIASFQEIERALKDKEKLEEVYFEGNPVQKQGPVLYRNKVRLALPQVAKIDAGEFPFPVSGVVWRGLAWLDDCLLTLLQRM